MIGMSGEQFEALHQALINEFQDKKIRFNDQDDVLVTTALSELLDIASGKAEIYVQDTLPATTQPNSQYWLKTYNGETLTSGRHIVMTDHVNTQVYIGKSSANMDDYYTKEQTEEKIEEFITKKSNKYSSGNRVVFENSTDMDALYTALMQVGQDDVIQGGDFGYNSGQCFLEYRISPTKLSSNFIFHVSGRVTGTDFMKRIVLIETSSGHVFSAEKTGSPLAWTEWKSQTYPKKYMHTLTKWNNVSKQYSMAWVTIIDSNPTRTYAQIANWLYTNGFTSMENTYSWAGGIQGTQQVVITNSSFTVRDTSNVTKTVYDGTYYIGTPISGAFSEDGAIVKFKSNYNASSTAAEDRCSIRSIEI